MWKWIGYLFAVLLLAYHSVFDIRLRCIPVKSLGGGVVISVCWAIGRILAGEQSLTEAGLGFIPGIAVLLLAGATREQVGRGDGWELVVMGGVLGWEDCLLGLGIALLGIFTVSAILLVLRKAERNARVPFVPFLCIGAVIAAVFHFTG